MFFSSINGRTYGYGKGERDNPDNWLDSDDYHDDHLHIGPIYQTDANNKIIYLKEKEE